jgi:hypothetical protein
LYIELEMMMYNNIPKIAWTKNYGDEKLACSRRNYRDNKLLQYEMCGACSTKGKVGTCVTGSWATNLEGSLADLLR